MNTRTRIVLAGLAVAISAALVLQGYAIAAQTLPQSGYGDSYGGYGYSSQQPYAGSAAGPVQVKGLEGLQGFGSGQNRLTLAVQLVSQQDNMLYFQVIGFAISSSCSGETAMYSLKTPFPGVLDQSQNTMQIDLSTIGTAVDQSGYVDPSQVYDIMRNNPKVILIDVDMDYQGTQDAQTIFNVTGVNIIRPDGTTNAFSLQQPTRLIIDSGNYRISAVAFPQMIDAFSSCYEAPYGEVSPVEYTEPVPVLAPVTEPYVEPIPLAYGGFAPYYPFYFPSGYRPFPHVFPTPHPTGLITPTPHFPTLHPTSFMPSRHPPTLHPTGFMPSRQPTRQAPTAHPTGFRPTAHATGFKPTDWRSTHEYTQPRQITPGGVHTPTGAGISRGGGGRMRR